MNNLLINQLPTTLRQRLLSASERIELQFGQILLEPGQNTEYAYFPGQAVACLLALLSDRQVLGVGLVGLEGMVGSHLLLGMKTPPLRAMVTVAGDAWRLGRVALHDLQRDNVGMYEVLARHLGTVMTGMAKTAACVRFHTIDQRLPLLLLMYQDRAASSTFRVTQELLASLLGVRRVSVTNAAGELQRRGLIHYHRAQVTVLDRTALEEAACVCYAAGSNCAFSSASHGKHAAA